MEQAYGFVAMRFYVTTKEQKASEEPSLQSTAEGEETKFTLPDNINPFLRSGRPSLVGLVEQAVEEGKVIGRVGIATCGNRGVNVDVKNAVAKNLRKDMPNIYCHAEEYCF